MRKLLACFVLLWAFWVENSNAADNAVTLTTGSGITMRTIDIGAGVQSSVVILGSSVGAAIYGTAGTANANVLTIQGVASMTKLLVTPDSVALPANQSTNISQINAVTPLMGNGVTGTGSMRVTIASDNTANSNPWLVTLSGTNNIATVTTVTSITNPVTVSTHAITIASGGVASGSYASGAIASGAFASGALASGSIAAGAHVDLLTMRQTVAAGTVAANSLLTGGQYNSTPITLTNTQGSALQLDVNGYLNVDVKNANANGQATMANSSPVTIASNQTANALWGHGVTAAAVPANATFAGVRGQNAEQTAVTNGQLVGLAADLVGKTIVMPYANTENFVSGGTAAMTGTTSTSVIASAGGSLRNYITACTFGNSHATVGTMILLQDGSGGTTLWEAPAAAVFGGAHVVFPTPLKTTAATALFSQNVTTGSNTFVFCTGYKGI